jgi:GNAT superfamily N-acetyltransferase
VNISITTAHPSEAGVLTEIAFAAKRHWGYPEHWLAQWQALLTVTPESVATHETFAAREGDRILGFGAIARDGDLLWLKDLWVSPAEMGRGIGRALFRRAQQRAWALGFATFEIEADPHAAGFYQRMGAVSIGMRASQIDGQVRELPLFRCGSLGSAAIEGVGAGDEKMGDDG